MKALTEMERKQEDNRQFRVYTYVDSHGFPTQEKQYTRIPKAVEPLTFDNDGAWHAIHALTAVGIPAWAEEVK